MAKSRLPIINNGTCYAVHNDNDIPCKKKSCRMWLEHGEGLNCAVLIAKTGPHTLQQIGDMFGVSRMRICQIERDVLSKFRTLID